jgi:invasion protein IalB
MSNTGLFSRNLSRLALGAGALAAGLMMGVSLAAAQDAAPAEKPAAAPAKTDAAKPAAPAAAAPAAAGKDAAAAANKSAWVKLCEKTPLVKKGEDGKDVKEEKDICLTHHERLDGNTGMVLVSAAIREVEGGDKKHLMVMVPLGMAIPPGLRAAVYNKDQWAKASKNEKVEDKDLKPVDLKYSLCHASGCTAEIEAGADVIDQMKGGGGIMVVAMNAGAQAVGFPVPLDGFTEAYAGKPINNEDYKKARGQLMAQIRERQKQAFEKYKKEQEQKSAKNKEMFELLPKDGAPAETGATTKPAAKPAE